MGALFTIILTIDCLADKPKKPPTEMEILFATFEKIVVLPAVDSRVGEKASVKLEDIQKEVLKLLKKKNYVAEAPANSGAASEFVEEDLKEAKPEWVKKLGPAEARWVLVVCLGDVTSKMTFGSTGNAEVSGYLYDKQDGKLIWKEKGVGQAGQGGLAGMMMKGAMKSAALNSAIYNLMSSVPKRPKPKK
jgi:hypothetical protein